MKINTLTINGNTFEISDPAVEPLSQDVEQLQNTVETAQNKINNLIQQQESCVRTVSQKLTDDQQAIVRENIGAMQEPDGSLVNFCSSEVKNVNGMEFICKDEDNQETGAVFISADKNKTDQDGKWYGTFEFSASGNPVMLRNIKDGIADTDAATVGQLNAALGNIETALDSIIAIQESLIGGAA